MIEIWQYSTGRQIGPTFSNYDAAWAWVEDYWYPKNDIHMIYTEEYELDYVPYSPATN